MPDFILPDGSEVNFDLRAFTRGDWSDWASGKMTFAQDDEFLARAAGVTVETVRSLSEYDYKRMIRALIVKVQAPLKDPN